MYYSFKHRENTTPRLNKSAKNFVRKLGNDACLLPCQGIFSGFLSPRRTRLQFVFYEIEFEECDVLQIFVDMPIDFYMYQFSMLAKNFVSRRVCSSSRLNIFQPA